MLYNLGVASTYIQLRNGELRTFCEQCSAPRRPRYSGKTLILEKVPCYCPCKITVFGVDGTRCADEKGCGHLVKIELTDSIYEEPDVYINPKTHQPVRVADVQPSSRHDD